MNIGTTLIKMTVIAGVVISLCSCAVNKEVSEAKKQMTARMNDLEKSMPKAEDSSNRKHILYRDGAYFGNKMVAVSSEKLLPPVFSKPFGSGEIKFISSSDGPVNLPTFAEMLTKYTGIRVEISQDIYLKSSALPSDGQGAVAGAATQVKNDQVSNYAYENERSISLDFKGSLANYLNLVSSKLGISWEYEAGTIHFFRYKRKSFEIKGATGAFKHTTAFSTAGQIGTGTGASSSSAGVSTKLTRDLDFSYLKDLTAQVHARNSAGGTAIVNNASSTITVTDTPERLRDIGLFLDDMNRRSIRVAYFALNLYRLSDTDGNQAGLNWSALMTSNKFRLFGIPGANLVTDTGGLGVFRLAPKIPLPTPSSPGSIGDGLSGGEGSSLLIQAINQMTGVSEEWYDNGYTLNNMPLPFSNSTTKEYVAEAGTTANNTSSSTTVTQKEYSFGVNIELTPHIYDNNSMMLEVVVDVTDGVPFEVTSVNGTQIKSKTVPRRASRQMLMVRPGEQIVLAKLGRNTNSGKNNVGLTGASSAVDKQKDSMLLVITPVLWSTPNELTH